MRTCRAFLIIYCLFLFIYNFQNVFAQGKNERSAEKSLIRLLLNRYKELGVIGRPVNNTGIKMVIQYGLQLIQILDLDENKQVLRTNCWAVYRWNDPLLRWNASQYDNINVVRVFPKQIWTPDIKLYNSADERLQEHREAGLLVYDDGSILWLKQSLFKTTCQVEITYFPFDSQVCMLEFGSLTYDRTQLELDWWTPDDSESPMPYVDFSDYVPANDWFADGEAERHLSHEKRTKQIRSVKRYRVRDHITDGVRKERYFPVLRFLVRLYRNPSFHMFILIVPCLLLSMLTLVVFWLPPDSPAKMMLGINIFVAFFVLLLLLAESMPSAVKNFPLIGVFFCLNMVMITLSTYLATIVVNLFYRGSAGRPLPSWVRRYMIDGIGRMLYLRQNIPLADVRRPRNIEEAGQPQQLSNTIKLVPNNSMDMDRGDACIDTHVRQRKCPPESSNCRNICVEMTNTEDDDLHTLLTDAVKPIHEETHSVHQDVTYLHNRQTKAGQRESIAMEWRTLAFIVDRLFFMLYLTIMAVALVTVVLKTEVIDMTLTLINRNAIALSED